MAEITKIDKLNGKNYQSWKYNVKLVLMERGLWGFIEGLETAPAEGETTAVKNAYKLRSDKAYSLIALNVEKQLQIHISSTTDPRVAWETFQKQFESVSITQIVRLNRRFFAATMEEGADLMQHITYMTSLAEQLRELKEDISSKKFATTILGSLPESYDAFLTSLNARKADELDWETVSGLLTEEYMKRQEKIKKQESEDALFTKRERSTNRGRNHWSRGPSGGRFSRQEQSQRDQQPTENNYGDKRQGVQCFRCDEFGHVARNCPRRPKRNENSNMAEEDGIALISSGPSPNRMNKCHKWFVDSAATKHMTHEKETLLDYIEYKQPTNIYLGDNTVIHAKGEGTVKLSTTNSGRNVTLELHKVLFVPDLTKNLMSVPAMALMGAEIRFNQDTCVVLKDGKEFIIGNLINNKLYTVNTNEFAQVSTTSTAPTLEDWHCRLGHLNYNYVNQLLTKEMVDGMSYDADSKPNKECEACLRGKMKKEAFPKKSEHRATRPFELVHSDICGPMQVESKGGSKYMLTFKDDYSRYTTVYFVKHKSETLSKFQEYVNAVEKQTGQGIKTLNIYADEDEVKTIRSDNGGEYNSKNFDKYCAEKGILHEFTNPYSPQQNGVAERLNRTIMESARSMLYKANLPLQFWAEACSVAVYLQNRSPTVALNNTTPFECLFKSKPDVSNLRVFGCVTYVHVPDSQRKKLDAKAHKAIFVGYPPGVKGYKLYDLEKGSFVISRNVKFFENRFDHFNDKMSKSGTDHFLPISSDVPQVLDEDPVGPEHIPPEVLIVPEAIEENPVVPEHIPPEVLIEPENAEPVGAQNGNVEAPVRRETYEDAFMEQVRQLGPVRQRRAPNKYADEDCLLTDSLTSDIDEPKSVEDALNGKHSTQWREAMNSEYSSLLENETWELVPPPEDTNIVGSRWVLKVKRDEDGSIDRFKARLVAQGYSQTKGVDYDEVFSPVARYTSIRTLLALGNAHDLEIHQMDVKTAFLNGSLDCDIYMSQPEGFVDPNRPDYVCKLNKSIYGLKQSARCWNVTLDQYLQSAGYRKSDADGCIYTKTVREASGRIIFVILGVYVDDIVPVSNDIELLNAEKAALCERFDMVDQGEIHYLLGMSIKRDRKSRTLTISQPAYLQKVVERFGMKNSKPVSTPLEHGKKFHKLDSNEEPFDVQTYQQAIGCLTHASTTTRPDIAVAVGMLAQYASEPSTDHWSGVKRVLRYINGTLNYGLKFTVNQEVPELVAYADADWAGDIDTRRSTSGYVFQFGGCTVSWSSKRQPTVAKSSTEAEYVALSSATQEAVWLRRLMKDLGKTVDKSTTIYEDNQGAQELARNPKYHNRTKHIDICHHFVRERVVTNEVNVVYCPSEDMVADIMTKALSKYTYQRLRDMLGVKDIV